MFASTENVKEKTFRKMPIDQKSALHRNICAVIVGMSVLLIVDSVFP